MLAEMLTAAALNASAAGDLDATFGGVRCPARTVTVTVSNAGSAPETYELFVGGKRQNTEQIPADTVLKTTVELAEDRRTRITVRALGSDVASTVKRADCRKSAGKGGASTRKTLPMTGTGTSLALTSVATVLTGGLLTWYGLLWPGRRERLFG